MVTIIEAPVPENVRTSEGEPGRRIEWIGEQSPLDHDFVSIGISTGRFTKDQVDLIRAAALLACKRTVDMVRRMSPEDPGLSREIEWGPGKHRWIQVLSYRDADILLSSASAHEFRDLDAIDIDAASTLIYPPLDVRLVGEDVVKVGTSVATARDILRRLGPQS